MKLKRLFAGALAAALVLSAAPAVPADAAANNAFPVKVQFTGAGYDSGDPWVTSHTMAFFPLNKGEEMEVTATSSISYVLYVPSTVFKTDGAVIQLGGGVDIFTSDWAHIGNIGVSKSFEVLNTGGSNFNTTYWDEATQTDVDANSYVSVTKTGDYYKFTVTNMPLRDSYYDDNGNQTSITGSTTAKVSAAIDIIGINTKTSATVYIDDVTFGGYTVTFDEADMEGSIEVNGGTEQVVKPTSYVNYLLKLAKAKATIKNGKKTTIKATTAPSAKVTYKSSNKKVATVTSKGVVKGKKKGKATITVTANGVSKKFKVTVK